MELRVGRKGERGRSSSRADDTTTTAAPLLQCKYISDGVREQKVSLAETRCFSKDMFHSEDDAAALPLNDVLWLVISPTSGHDDFPIGLFEAGWNIVSRGNTVQKLITGVQVLDPLPLSPSLSHPPSSLDLMNIKPLTHTTQTPRRGISRVHFVVPREVQRSSQ